MSLTESQKETGIKNEPNPTERILRFLLVLASIYFVALYIFVALQRILYPFELEWMEGGCVEHVKRLLDGKPLYVKPSLEFVTYIYPPLYFYVSALVAKFIGVGFFPLRLVSFISSIGVFVFIFLFVKKETRNAFFAWLSVGFFASTFHLGGSWLDLARLDSLFLFLVLAGLYASGVGRRWPAFLVSGVVISLAFLTKQSSIFVALPVIIYLFITNWRMGIVLVATITVISGLSVFMLDRTSGGWFNYYIFYLPSHHRVLERNFIEFWTRDIFRPLWILAVLSLVAIWVMVRQKGKEISLFHLAMAIGLFGGAWVSRLHTGAYTNVLIPAYASMAILAGMGIHIIVSVVKQKPSLFRKTAEIVVLALCLLQFRILVYDPAGDIPKSEDMAAGKLLIRELAGVEGELFIPGHSYYSTMAGKPSLANIVAIRDVLAGDEGQARQDLAEEAVEAVKGRRFAAVAMGQSDSLWELFGIRFENYYEPGTGLFENGDVFWPVTGNKHRPSILFVPKRR